MSNDWEKGFLEGKQFGYSQGFSTGFWSAVLLIGGAVCFWLLLMRALEVL